MHKIEDVYDFSFTYLDFRNLQLAGIHSLLQALLYWKEKAASLRAISTALFWKLQGDSKMWYSESRREMDVTIWPHVRLLSWD